MTNSSTTHIMSVYF